MSAPQIADAGYPAPVAAWEPRRAGSTRRRTAGARTAPETRAIIAEDLFRHALIRERKRADRFEEAFALVLIGLEGEATTGGTAVVNALTEHGLESDLIGWYEQGAVLGLIRCLDDHDAADAAATLAATVRRQLVHALKRKNSEGCSLRIEVYSPRREAVPAFLLEPHDLRQTTGRHIRHLGKRILDVTGSLALIVVLSPVFLLLAALVKATSRGPVLFRQQRIGVGGRPFMMLKFRTMHANADEAIHRQYVTAFIKSGAGMSAKGGVFKIVNDPRVTPIGRFLRRSSLDELPQFFNVLTGEMSLVGPRPPLVYEVENYKPWHRRRLLEAKPGITGLWQVKGRSRTTFEEMVRLDLRYAKSHSVWTDIKILAATPRAVVTGKGAH